MLVTIGLRKTCKRKSQSEPPRRRLGSNDVRYLRNSRGWTKRLRRFSMKNASVMTEYCSLIKASRSLEIRIDSKAERKLTCQTTAIGSPKFADKLIKQ